MFQFLLFSVRSIKSRVAENDNSEGNYVVLYQCARCLYIGEEKKKLGEKVFFVSCSLVSVVFRISAREERYGFSGYLLEFYYTIKTLSSKFTSETKRKEKKSFFVFALEVYFNFPLQ